MTCTVKIHNGTSQNYTSQNDSSGNGTSQNGTSHNGTSQNGTVYNTVHGRKLYVTEWYCYSTGNITKRYSVKKRYVTENGTSDASCEICGKMTPVGYLRPRSVSWRPKTHLFLFFKFNFFQGDKARCSFEITKKMSIYCYQLSPIS